MRAARVALALGVLAAGPAAGADDCDAIAARLLSEESRGTIEGLKQRVDQAKSYSDKASKLPGLDDEIADQAGKLSKYLGKAGDALDKGMKVADIADLALELEKSIDCLNCTMDCMTGDRSPGCVKGYAIGMGHLVSTAGHLAEKSSGKNPATLILKYYGMFLGSAENFFEDQHTNLGACHRHQDMCEAICADYGGEMACDVIRNGEPPAVCQSLEEVFSDEKAPGAVVDQESDGGGGSSPRYLASVEAKIDAVNPRIAGKVYGWPDPDQCLRKMLQEAETAYEKVADTAERKRDWRNVVDRSPTEWFSEYRARSVALESAVCDAQRTLARIHTALFVDLDLRPEVKDLERIRRCPESRQILATMWRDE